MLKHKVIERCQWGASKMLPLIQRARQIRTEMDAQAQAQAANYEKSATIIRGYGDTVPSQPQKLLAALDEAPKGSASSRSTLETEPSSGQKIQQVPLMFIESEKHSVIDSWSAKESSVSSLSVMPDEPKKKPTDTGNNSSLLNDAAVSGALKATATIGRKGLSIQDKLWSICAAGNTVPIPFLKAIDISPLALVTEDRVSSAGSNAALEAVKELFSGDGQMKKGRRGQPNEVSLPPGVYQRLNSSPTLMNLAQALAYHKTCYEDMSLQELQAAQEQQVIQNLCDTLRTILRL